MLVVFCFFSNRSFKDFHNICLHFYFGVNFFNLGFICECIYGVVLGLLKLHCQYGSNFHWESSIDLIVIFNYIRELFFPYLTRYKVFVLGALSCFWCESNFFCFVKLKKSFFSTCFGLNPNKKLIAKMLTPLYGIQHQEWGIKNIWCIIQCLLMFSIIWLKTYLHFEIRIF